MNNQSTERENSSANRRPVIFISGPMTGKDYLNRDAFNCAERQLGDLDFIVLNPAIFPDGLRPGQYMVMTLAMLEQADAIYLLDGWEYSKGATAEAVRARELGLMFYGQSLDAVKGVMALPPLDYCVVGEATASCICRSGYPWQDKFPSFRPFVTPESEVR